VSEIVSERGRYGHVVAIPTRNRLLEGTGKRSILDSYARLAASALDSEATVIEARRQTETAQALLALSTTWPVWSSGERWPSHLARTIPSVIDCDRTIVSLALSDSEKHGRMPPWISIMKWKLSCGQ